MTIDNYFSPGTQGISSADQKRLSEFLMKRLIECGWEEELGEVYKKLVEEHEGWMVTNEMLMNELNIRAPMVPDEIKLELLQKIVQCRGGGPYILNIYNTQKGLQLKFTGVQIGKGVSFEVYVRVNVKRVPIEMGESN